MPFDKNIMDDLIAEGFADNEDEARAMLEDMGMESLTFDDIGFDDFD